MINGIGDEDGIESDDGEDAERIEFSKEEEVLKRITDPKLPSQKEVDDHSLLGHIPYRNWCAICVKSQGRDSRHMRDNNKERKLPEYSWDYCFPGNECGYHWTVLVGKERQSGGIMATAVPQKGGTGAFTVDKCVDFINEMGDRNRDIIVKSDQ